MRIPALIDLNELLGGKCLGDDDLEDIFGEPLVGHHEPTLLSRPLAPRILNFVPDRLASLRVDVYAADDHRMCHGRLVDLETLFLSQTELDVESRL